MYEIALNEHSLACRQASASFYKSSDVRNSNASTNIGEHERPLTAHPLGISIHHFETGADHRCEINLINDKQIAFGYAWAAFARNFVAR